MSHSEGDRGKLHRLHWSNLAYSLTFGEKTIRRAERHNARMKWTPWRRMVKDAAIDPCQNRCDMPLGHICLSPIQQQAENFRELFHARACIQGQGRFFGNH